MTTFPEMAKPDEEPCWNRCPWGPGVCDLAKGHPGRDPNWCAAFWNGISHHTWDNRVSITLRGKPADPKTVASIIKGGRE